jgi:hypothetical protein
MGEPILPMKEGGRRRLRARDKLALPWKLLSHKTSGLISCDLRDEKSFRDPRSLSFIQERRHSIPSISNGLTYGFAPCPVVCRGFVR